MTRGKRFCSVSTQLYCMDYELRILTRKYQLTAEDAHAHNLAPEEGYHMITIQ